MQATGLLHVRGLSKSFRGLKALEDYALDLPARTIHGVIGPNGAGKTTLFHLLSGFLRPTTGNIQFDGRDITATPAYRVDPDSGDLPTSLIKNEFGPELARFGPTSHVRRDFRPAAADLGPTRHKIYPNRLRRA